MQTGGGEELKYPNLSFKATLQSDVSVPLDLYKFIMSIIC